VGNARLRTLVPAATVLAFSLFTSAAAQALILADVIPDATFARGFGEPVDTSVEPPVPAPSPLPNYLFSDDPADFLAASVNAGAAVTFSIAECFIFDGSGGCASSVPEGVAYTGLTTWTVTAIDVEVPEDGLFFFVGGMGNGDTPVPPGNPPAPDYALGSVQMLVGGGTWNEVTLPPLEEALATFGGAVDFTYFGTQIFEVGEALTFGFSVDEQLAGGTPIFFSNAARDVVVVPEPGTLVLVGVGLASLAAVRRGRSRRAAPPRS
jgi:hypothetical protein